MVSIFLIGVLEARTRNMRFLFILGICLALVFVVECFDQKDFIEDEERIDKRHLYKGCKSDADCGSGKCCADFGIIAKCTRIWRLVREGKTCSLKSAFCSFFRCQDGLECRRTNNVFFGRYKCFKAAPPPTEQPGSGDFDL